MGLWKVGEQERDLRMVVFEVSDFGYGEEGGRGRCSGDWKQFLLSQICIGCCQGYVKGLLVLSIVSYLFRVSCWVVEWGSGVFFVLFLFVQVL